MKRSKVHHSSRYFLGKEVDVVMDRPLGTSHPKHGYIYEVNYGYVPNTISGDGMELDVYVLGVNEPLEIFSVLCVAIIHRTNDNDNKLIVVPRGVVLSEEEIRQRTYFQEQWFKSEIWISKEIA